MSEHQPLFENVNLAESHPREIESISKSIESREVDYSEKGAARNRREIVREVMNEKTASAPSSYQDDTLSAADKVKVMKKEEQLKRVLQYAGEHGPVKASAMVKKIGDPWLEDQFHDLLLKTHDELVRAKQLREE